MTTPIRAQYLRIKKQYPDTIVFFRLGDFYETFDGDAKIVANVCNIVLTSREMDGAARVPLAVSRRRNVPRAVHQLCLKRNATTISPRS